MPSNLLFFFITFFAVTASAWNPEEPDSNQKQIVPAKPSVRATPVEKPFHFTFNQDRPNTKAATKIITEASMELALFLDDEEQQILTGFLETIDEYVNAIQRYKIPHRSPLHTAIHYSLARPESTHHQNVEIPIRLANRLFLTFALLLRTDHFMFGQVDGLHCQWIASAVKHGG